MLKVYEAWKQHNKGPSIVFGEIEAIEEDRNSGILGSDARFLHKVEARTWEEAMMRHHELMKWMPYKPMGEAVSCPNDCGATFYPEGSGECPNCGQLC